MAVSEAVVDLLFKAQNLAGGAVSELEGQVKGIGAAGVAAAGKFAGAFKSMGGALANSIGNSVENLTTGGDLGPTLLMAGGYMAGQLAEEFGGQMIEKLASSGLVAALTAPLAALGSALGGIIAAAIPIGMALLPVILIGALIAAITVLIVNPEIRGKVFAFAGEMVGHIGDALRTGLGILATIIPQAFQLAFGAALGALQTFIGAFVGFILGIPGRLISLGGDIVRTVIGGLGDLGRQVALEVYKAFSSLHLDIGPFHISASGVSVDLPNIPVPHFAVGTPFVPADTLAVVHRGEAIIPAASNPFAGGTAGTAGSGGFTIQGFTEREIVDMVDRQMYFRLRRAGTLDR